MHAELSATMEERERVLAILNKEIRDHDNMLEDAQCAYKSARGADVKMYAMEIESQLHVLFVLRMLRMQVALEV